MSKSQRAPSPAPKAAPPKEAPSVDADAGNAAAQQAIAQDGASPWDEATAGPTVPVPHRDEVEAALGMDLGDVDAQAGDDGAVGGLARLEGEAAAHDDTLVFDEANPDFETVLHEAAHLKQKGGGGGGDPEEPGDASSSAEGEAEAVASAGARGQEIPETEESAPGINRIPGEVNQELEDLLNAVGAKFVQVLTARRDGVEEIRLAAEHVDPPPAWIGIAIAVGSIALAACTAGIGTVVAGAVVGAATSEAVKEMIKVATEETLKTTVTAVVGAASEAGSDPKDAFFAGQKDACTAAGNTAADTFNLSGKARIRRDPAPVDAARALFNTLDRQLAIAKSTQKNTTLASWCNFLARAELGTRGSGANEGVDLADQTRDTSAAGVLGMNLEVNDWNAMPVITDAEMESVPQGMRDMLESRPLGALGVALTAHGPILPPAWYEKTPARGNLSMGINEAGTSWFDTSSYGARSYLSHVAAPDAQGIDSSGTHQLVTDAYVAQGRTIVLNHIKSQNLRSSGVELDY